MAGEDSLSWLTDDISVRDAVRRLTRLFEARGFWGASQDARALVGHVTGLDFSGLILRGEGIIPPAVRLELVFLAERRLRFEPVGRILGSRDFMGLELEVTADTLEPREDTEILVECALDFIDASGLERPVVVDIGTGTGAVLIAILARRHQCFGVAIDISPGALATAARNATRHGVSDRFAVFVGDMASALAPDCCDLIVSNPPYIPTSEIATLDPDVRAYDPVLALDGGHDGLVAYRALLSDARSAVRSGCPVMVEIGATQGREVSALMTDQQFASVSVVSDRAGRDRVVSGLRTIL